MTRKVVSIALFGDGDKYGQYLGAFVRAHLNLFPVDEGWELRVHVDNSMVKTTYWRFLQNLEDAYLLDLQVMGPAILTRAMLWRMVPVFKPNVDYVFCRDLDACPMPRDRAVCDQFIASEAAVGTCHDNLAHAGVMGGLCHFRTADFCKQTGLHTLEDLYRFAQCGDEQWAQHGTDQNVLNRLIDRPNGPTLLEHRFNGWTCGATTDYRRQAGTYQCPAWSTPTPDKGVSRLTGDLTASADRLGNHLGSAGYDHEMAKKFWDLCGDPDIARVVAACEEES